MSIQSLKLILEFKIKQTYILITVVGIQVLQRCRHHAFRGIPVQEGEWFACLQVTAGLGRVVIFAFFLLSLGLLGILGLLLGDPSLDGFEGLAT